MAKKAFLLRIDDTVLAAVQRWADEDLRSLNGQIEYILRQALTRHGVNVKPVRDEKQDDEDDK